MKMDNVLELFQRLSNPEKDPHRGDVSRMSYLIGGRRPEATARLARLALYSHFHQDAELSDVFESDLHAATFFRRTSQLWPWIWIWNLREADPFIRWTTLDSVKSTIDLQLNPSLKDLNVSMVFLESCCTAMWTEVEKRFTDSEPEIRLKSLQLGISVLRTSTDATLVRSVLDSLIGRSRDFESDVRLAVLEELDPVPAKGLDRDHFLDALSNRLLDQCSVVREAAIVDLSYAYAKCVSNLGGSLVPRSSLVGMIRTCLIRYSDSNAHERYLIEKSLGQFLLGNCLVAEPRRVARNLINLLGPADGDELLEPHDGSLTLRALLHILRAQSSLRRRMFSLFFSREEVAGNECAELALHFGMDRRLFRQVVETFMKSLDEEEEPKRGLHRLLASQVASFTDVSETFRWLTDASRDEDETDEERVLLKVFRKRFIHKTGIALIDSDVIFSFIDQVSRLNIFIDEENESETRLSPAGNAFHSNAARLVAHTLAVHSACWLDPKWGPLLRQSLSGASRKLLLTLGCLVADWNSDDERVTSLKLQIEALIDRRALRLSQSSASNPFQ